MCSGRVNSSCLLYDVLHVRLGSDFSDKSQTYNIADHISPNN